MLSPIVDHTFVWEGNGKEGEMWRSCLQWQNYKRRHVKEAELRTGSTLEPLLKKEIKLLLVPRTTGNRKWVCAWSCSRWQTQPEKISKLQSTNQFKRVNDTDLCFEICRFSQVLCVHVTLNNLVYNLIFYFQQNLVLIFHIFVKLSGLLKIANDLGMRGGGGWWERETLRRNRKERKGVFFYKNGFAILLNLSFLMSISQEKDIFAWLFLFSFLQPSRNLARARLVRFPRSLR